MPSPEQAGAILEVDLDALTENHRRLAATAAGAECAGVVKADAYGLGMAEVAPALWRTGCRSFFVAHVAEGIALRALLPQARILVLHGPYPGTEATFAAEGLIPVLNEPGQLARWRAQARGMQAPLPAALHLDTGMNRLGFSVGELEALAAEPAPFEGIDLVLAMSHMIAAEDHGSSLSHDQRQRFDALRARLPAVPASLANSAAVFLGPDYHYDLVRPGSATYGINPTPGSPNPMLEVVRLKGRILQVREIDRAETVGYGATYRAPRPRRIATVPVGYADGYLRSLGNRGMAMIAGIPVPVVGRVSMDLITVDVSDVPEAAARPGGWVDLIGNGIDIDEVGDRAGTIGYEILTALGHRYHRVYSGGDAA